MAEPQYAILRVEKVKDFASLGARSAHNTRQTANGIEHTDGSGVEIFHGKSNIIEAWNDRAAEVGFDKSTMRKNAVVGVEFLTTASPDWFKSATPEQLQEWVSTSTDFVASQIGGKRNVLQAVLHTDEETPHLQFLCAPFIQKEMKARGRNAEDKPTTQKVVLSSRDYIGGHRSRLEDMQTDYHAEVAHLGLERGKPRKETGARNMRPSQWRAQEAKQLDETGDLLRMAQERLAKVEAREKAVNLERKKLAKDAQALVNSQIAAKTPRDPEAVRISNERFDLPPENPASPQHKPKPRKRRKARDDDQR